MEYTQTAMPSHQDKLHTGATSKEYRDNYNKIFFKHTKTAADSEWEKVEKNGKTTYRKKK